jgi:hypothetical protein
MPEPQEVSEVFAANLWVIKRQVEGLSHEESLIQPPFRGNCLNWVLGHIVVGRNNALAYLGQEPLWGDAETELYATGSEPITSAGDAALPLEDLVALLDQSQERLVAVLADLDPETWGKNVQQLGRERPLGQAIAGLAWHETYHAGQTELLRQLAGKADKVI